LKLALEALKGLKSMYGGNGHKLHEINMIHRKHDTAITALEEALAQTQEPVSNDPLPRACNLAGVDYQTFLKIKAYMPVAPPQRTWVGLTDEQLRTEFGKLYPNDIGILELAENNRDFAVEAIGARHHWVAF
jgi:hypothetical protein